MRKPQSNSLIAWFDAAVGDLADSFERLNRDLDRRDTDPRWGRKVWNDSWDLLSLRRWAFLLPGGGALRGGRPPKIIRPARPISVAGDDIPPATPGPVTRPGAAVTQAGGVGSGR